MAKRSSDTFVMCFFMFNDIFAYNCYLLSKSNETNIHE